MVAEPSQPPYRRGPLPARRPATGEPWYEQASSFIGFFIYLLILKTFFLPLFIIPTGSMAATLYGEHAPFTCPNCGVEYAVAWQPQGTPTAGAYHPVAQCPNCRYRVYYGDPAQLHRARPQPDRTLDRPLSPIAGDRIFVQGWPFEPLFAGVEALRPQRWDVVVFKVPTDGETNYIKRLIGRPGEKIELIDGDVFVNDVVADKPLGPQSSLWFPYYDHDFPPAETAPHANYRPVWTALDSKSPWHAVDSRAPRFAGVGQPRADLQFATDPGDPRQPGRVEDVYAYNEPHSEIRYHTVNDVRLSAEVEFDAGPPDGYVELGTTKAFDCFYARLYRDGRVALLHRKSTDDVTVRTVWAQHALGPLTGPVHLALLHVDGRVLIEIDGARVPDLVSPAADYTLTPAMARAQARNPKTPTLRIAAENAALTLRHLLIERDVYYTSDIRSGRAAYGVDGSPIRLGPQDYFLLGDNSPNSQDARYAFARPDQDPVGPHLKQRFASGDFHLGTVPADQLIGPTFFVYWPGFQPLFDTKPLKGVLPPGVRRSLPDSLNLCPDLGRVRWVH